MANDPLVWQLLEDLIDSERSPEEVCAGHPELLGEVRRRWARYRRLDANLNAMFPAPEDRPGLAAGPAPAAAPASEKLPEVPGFDVEAVLGRGGMGVVYKARHLKLDRAVAIKTILGGACAGAEQFSRLTREASAVARLRHANIVQVYDVGDLDGLPYYVMEYVEGGSLGQRLAGTPQPPRRAAQLARDLARAVQAAHDAGIVHRDLKPGNVLLTADGTPKIADFGLARQAGEDPALTQSGVRLGTPSYMAPEQASADAGSVGPATDVYGVGAILYELLTGRPPFRAATAAETLRQVVRQDPAPPKRLNARVPRDVETICLKCLHKEPPRRYASAAALADDLGRFLEGRPIVARPPGWLGRVRRWARRDPAAAGLAATALCLAAVAVAGGFWVERLQAQRRTDAALEEGRTFHAVNASLKQAATLQHDGRWPEARAVILSIPDLSGPGAPAALRERVRRARVDADLVAELEDIRLPDGLKVRNPRPATEGQLYARAFAKYGIDLETGAPAEAAARIHESAVRDTLVGFLNDWWIWVPQGSRDKLAAVIDASDPDAWRRELRAAVVTREPLDLRALSARPEAAVQPPVVLSGLANALVDAGHADAARAMLRAAQQGHPDDFWINYQLGQLTRARRPQEAAGYFRAAVAIRPGSDQAHTLLGRALRDDGDVEGAVVALRRALDLNPRRAGTKDLVAALAARDRLREARVVWKGVLDRDPPEHEVWYGYAQLCLFLGEGEEYRRHRAALLDRFGHGDDTGPGGPSVAERTALAGLLLPGDDADLRRAAALAGRVVDAHTKGGKLGSPYRQFLKGFSELRQGRAGESLPFLGAAAGELPNRAGPRLALAMAQHRAGRGDLARATLAVAVRNHDWEPTRADHATEWVSHVLRREAEGMILPGLAAVLRGEARPRDNDERLASLGACQANRRYALAATLFADACEADPGLAGRISDECVRRAAGETEPANRVEALDSNWRYVAARCAALAASGRGADGRPPGDAEKAHWRGQARRWLREELDAWEARVQVTPGRVGLRAEALTQWRANPDLSDVRDPERLDALPEGERAEWVALWREVETAVSLDEP